MDSAVPYSLSDIQLPDSPSNIVKPSIKATSKKEALPTQFSNNSDKDSHSDDDVPRNGLNPSSKPQMKTKSNLDDTFHKTSKKEPKKEQQNVTSDKCSKTSDGKTELAVTRKNKQTIDCKEKLQKKVRKERRDSSTSGSSSEESQDSNDSKGRKKSRSKISVKHSKIHKNRSRSSSSSSQNSKKDSKNVKKKSLEPGANNQHNTGTSKSKSHTSSSSSQSRETSPEPSNKDAIKTIVSTVSSIVKHDNTSNRKSSKSKSRSPSSRDRKSLKLSKENVEKSIELDVSKTNKKFHSKSSSGEKVSKSKSQSPRSSRSSQSRESSPVMLSKETKIKLSDSAKIVKKRDKSSSVQKASKSRSCSTSSSKSRERSPVKQSKDIKKFKTSKSDTKNCSDTSSDQKSSKSRSRSPSSSRSQERSPFKLSKKSIVSDVSRTVGKNRAGSSSDHMSSKSRSRSPSSQERSPLKLSKDIDKTSITADVKNKSIDQKTLKKNIHLPSDRKSQEISPKKPSGELKKSFESDVSCIKMKESADSSVKKILRSGSESPSNIKSQERSRSRSSSTSSRSQSREKSPVKPPKVKSLKSGGSLLQKQKTSKSRSRSSSSSPPPRQTLEHFSKNKKTSEVPSSESIKTDTSENINKHSKQFDKKGSLDIDQKSNLSSDPPRKKLKINRNNIVISSLDSSEKFSSESLSENTSKVSSKIEKESESANSTQFETVEREMGEIIENSPEVKYEPRKINFPGRKLSRKSSEDLSANEPKSKKSKWGKFASSQKSSQTINISTDSLKNWFPEFKLVNEPAVASDTIPEESPPVKEDKKLSFPLKTEEESTQQSSFNTGHQNNEEPNLETTEFSGPVSKIVFIQNLVRPFTLLQLKDLLRQTGSFIEEDFWIDKIKSKCFVTYTTEEEAIKTRNALNGVRWPSSNPKILSAEFSTEDEFEYHRSGKDTQKPILERLPEVHDTLDDKTPQPASDHRRKDRDSDKRKERERYRPQAPVREWDKDKVLQDSPDRQRSEKNIEGYRGSDRKDKKDTKKRVNEDTPAKLLDDLFQKTKSIPCIYWLPLTDAQVLEHEESKRLRRLEREKRNQQREKEEAEHRNKRSRLDHKSREMESRRSSTRSRSPTSRRR